MKRLEAQIVRWRPILGGTRNSVSQYDYNRYQEKKNLWICCCSRLTGCVFSEPCLDANERDRCQPEDNEKRDNLTAFPSVDVTTPLFKISS